MCITRGDFGSQLDSAIATTPGRRSRGFSTEDGKGRKMVKLNILLGMMLLAGSACGEKTPSLGEALAFAEGVAGGADLFGPTKEFFRRIRVMYPEEIMDHFLRKLETGDLGDRENAIAFLGKWGSRRASGAILLQTLDTDDRIVRYAFDALQLLGDPRVIPFLRTCLEREDPNCLRALQCLARLGAQTDASAADRLVQDFMRRTEGKIAEELLIGAIEALGWIAEPTSREVVERFLKAESEGIRRAAEKAVFMIDVVNADDTEKKLEEIRGTPGFKWWANLRLIRMGKMKKPDPFEQ
jgi:hypothetical protein